MPFGVEGGLHSIESASSWIPSDLIFLRLVYTWLILYTPTKDWGLDIPAIGATVPLIYGAINAIRSFFPYRNEQKLKTRRIYLFTGFNSNRESPSY